MSNEKYFDWKGNEVKAGMIIYFVQIKPMAWGRFGVLMLDTGNVEYTETEEDYQKRKNEKLWILGDEYLVEEDGEGRLYVTHTENGAGEFKGYTFSTSLFLGSKISFPEIQTIAIKGISETN